MDSGRSVVVFIWILIICVCVVAAITKSNAMSPQEFRSMVDSNHIKIKANMEDIVKSLNADGYYCNYDDSYGGNARCYLNIGNAVKEFDCVARSCSLL